MFDSRRYNIGFIISLGGSIVVVIGLLLKLFNRTANNTLIIPLIGMFLLGVGQCLNKKKST